MKTCFIKQKKSVLSTLVLAQLWLSTSVHAPNVTVLLLSGESIFEQELQGNTSIAELTDLVKEQLQFPGELLASKPGITVNPTTRLGEIATDGHVSLTFVKYDRVEHILSGSYTIGVRAIRIDRQEQYILVLRGSGLCEEIDITALRNWSGIISSIAKSGLGLRRLMKKKDKEINRERHKKAETILQSLLSDGMNDLLMKQILDLEHLTIFSLSDDSDINKTTPSYEYSNQFIGRDYKSAYEMAIKEIHALEFVISQLTKKDPAEARPLQESINWIKHELDSRNTNDDLVNAIWFTYKRTQVLRDIYDLVDLKALVYFSDSLLDIENALSDLSCEGIQVDREALDRIERSTFDFEYHRSNNYYVEVPAKVWKDHLIMSSQVHIGSLDLPKAWEDYLSINQGLLQEDNVHKTELYIINKLSSLLAELSRT